MSRTQISSIGWHKYLNVRLWLTQFTQKWILFQCQFAMMRQKYLFVVLFFWLYWSTIAPSSGRVSMDTVTLAVTLKAFLLSEKKTKTKHFCNLRKNPHKLTNVPRLLCSGVTEMFSKALSSISRRIWGTVEEMCEMNFTKRSEWQV